MIKVTRLNGSEMYVNSDLIETLEATPDTVVTLTTDDKWVILESPEEVIARIVAFKRSTFGQLPRVIEPDSEQ